MNAPTRRARSGGDLGRLLQALRLAADRLEDGVARDRDENPDSSPVAESSPEPGDREELARRAAAIYGMRRARDEIIGAGLFGEGAWDLLLDLYAREAAGKRTYVSSACVAAAVPATTALRYIHLLHQSGLVNRSPDPFDGRRIFLELTPTARERLDAVLRKAAPPDL